jgi:hypothetical protein
MTKYLLSLLFYSFMQLSFAQSKANDIPVDQLPAEVKAVLEQYLKILSTSANLDECATNMMAVAGGSLVDEAGASLRSTIKPYSLKKDYDNYKFYASPTVITRVNKTQSNGSGFGASAIKGTVYKIWIGKKNGSAGLPAPISIMVPEGHATIKTPKVIAIGSL